MIAQNISYNNYNLNRMQEEDFDIVKAFLDEQRSMLDKIEFFYPYKDDELRQVLSNGYFLGLFDGKKLISTFGIDFDEDYAKKIAEIIRNCNHFDIDKAYESSGLMVDSNYRGQGIANFMMDCICKEAESRKVNICGVVQIENFKSMTTFFSHGFELRGIWSMAEKYDFAYLVKAYLQENIQNLAKKSKRVLHEGSKYDIIGDVEGKVEFLDIKKHIQMLDNNFYGIKCDKKCVYYIHE